VGAAATAAAVGASTAVGAIGSGPVELRREWLGILEKRGLEPDLERSVRQTSDLKAGPAAA
jgi:hypothetical protein